MTLINYEALAITKYENCVMEGRGSLYYFEVLKCRVKYLNILVNSPILVTDFT